MKVIDFKSLIDKKMFQDTNNRFSKLTTDRLLSLGSDYYCLS